MSQEKFEVTLKPGPMWQGMSDESVFSPSGGAFSRLKNCYISRDGTEIRRMPPLTKWAEPVMSTPHQASAMTFGAETTVTLTTPVFLEYTGSTPNRRVYVYGNSSIANGWYLARIGMTSGEVDQNKLVISVVTVGNSTDGVFFVEAATRACGMRMVGDKLAIVAETSHGEAVNIVGSENRISRAVATFVQKVPLDYLVPFGGSGTQFEYWYSAVNAPVSMSVPVSGFGPPSDFGRHGWAQVGTKFAANSGGSGVPPNVKFFGTVTAAYNQFSYSIAGPTLVGNMTVMLPTHDRPARRRPQIDAADGRLLIAIPGEGVIMSTQVSAYESDLNYATKYTRCLGVPKGVITSQDLSVTSSNSTGTLIPGVYQIAVGYKDRRTGELGLVSEVVSYTLQAPNNTLAVAVMTPRAVLREAYDLSIVIYLSDKDGSAGTMRPVVETNLAGNLVQHDYIVNVPDLVDIERRVPDIEQMPMGGSIVRSIKGITHIGGLLSPSAEAPGIGSVHIGVDWHQVGPTEIAVQPDSPGSGATTTQNSVAADGEIPPSFAGIPIAYSDLPQAVLDRRLNGNSTHLHRWELRSGHPVKLAPSDEIALLFFPRGSGWFSERGAPGVMPAANRLLYDRLTGYDLTGYGRYADSLVGCTDRETYVTSWDRSSFGVDPQMVSSEFGCIAASSMVSFDGGCAWLSAQGPVVFAGGGVEWIGRPIAKLFQTYKRDSRGMMTHAFAAHDTERKLVLFFVRADTNSAAYANASNDDAKSKISCDTVLVWSYMANAWSYWTLPAAFECVDAEMVLCKDSVMRMGILTETGIADGTRCVWCFDEELRDTIVGSGTEFDAEIITKFGVYHPEQRLERGAKIGAVYIRHEVTQPVTGVAVAGFVTDDLGVETTMEVGRAASNTRTQLRSGAVRAQDAQVRLRFAGVGRCRIKDITLEVSPGG